MPRSTGALTLALAVAALSHGLAAALEEGAEPVAGGGKGQDHVDLSIGGADDADRGYDHVDFSIDGSDPIGGDKDESHVDFCVDPAGAYTVAVHLMPGTDGAEICGFDGGPEYVHVDFRITIRPDGRIEVNGQALAACDPANGSRISLSWCPGTGALVVQAEDADGAVCAAQYAMEGAPEGVRISAAAVSGLSVQRQ